MTPNIESADSAVLGDRVKDEGLTRSDLNVFDAITVNTIRFESALSIDTLNLNQFVHRSGAQQTVTRSGNEADSKQIVNVIRLNVAHQFWMQFALRFVVEVMAVIIFKRSPDFDRRIVGGGG